MKTNIIHILILAIILIVGWSLFTVLQDFSDGGILSYDKYSTMDKGKQYLPLTPESYSRQQKYPVYKLPNHVQTQIAKSQSSSNQPSYRVVENGYAVSTNNNRSESIVPDPSAPNVGSDLTHPSTYNSSIGGSLSDGHRMVQALRSATDSRAVAQQRQLGKKKAYNDIPVGDGLYLMLLMAGFYAIFKPRVK